MQNKEEIYTWINSWIPQFKEWYQPVDFGNGIIAHVTKPPDWSSHPELSFGNDVGITKWNYIIKKHIPDLKGKRVLDLGCSCGLFSIEMVKMGAGEVIGIDRDTTIQHRSTNVPPVQDVIYQANMVKLAFEALENEVYPITYIAHDIAKIKELNLGFFDFVLALCVVYHELDKMFDLIEYIGTITNHIVLQANLGHSGPLLEWSSIQSHINALEEAGFTNVKIDAPQGYMLPVIIGKK